MENKYIISNGINNENLKKSFDFFDDKNDYILIESPSTDSVYYIDKDSLDKDVYDKTYSILNAKLSKLVIDEDEGFEFIILKDAVFSISQNRFLDKKTSDLIKEFELNYISSFDKNSTIEFFEELARLKESHRFTLEDLRLMEYTLGAIIIHDGDLKYYCSTEEIKVFSNVENKFVKTYIREELLSSSSIF